MTDNGGEFDNDLFRSNAENFDFTVISTAAENPFSNGTCERHNQVLTETFLKTRESAVNCDDDLCMRQAVFAKNCLLNVGGYSPYQLRFGCLPNLLSVITIKPPAWENKTSSESVRQYLSTLHIARKANIQAESSERIMRALRHNVRSDERMLAVGDEVYYQRRSKVWRGPGKIIGIDGKICFVRHSGRLIKVHKTRLRLVNGSHKQTNCNTSDNQTPNEKHSTKATSEESYTISDEDCDAIETESVSSEPKEQDVEHVQAGPTRHQRFEDSANDQSRDRSETGNDGTVVLPTKDATHLPKVGMKVRIFPDSEFHCDATGISRAGKANGKHKAWFNVEYILPESVSGLRTALDFENSIDHWENVDSNVLMTTVDAEASRSIESKEAQDAEIASWKELGVYTVVADNGQPRIGTRWVCSIKPNGVRKARLFAKGFQDSQADQLIKDSPTCTKETFRILLSLLASSPKRNCVAVDIKTALLQGATINRTLFLKPPEDQVSSDDVSWKLNKCVYGLVDASKHWYDRVCQVFASGGFDKSDQDPCLFTNTHTKHFRELCAHMLMTSGLQVHLIFYEK